MKKQIRMAMAALMAAAVLAGCGSGAKETSGSKETAGTQTEAAEAPETKEDSQEAGKTGGGAGSQDTSKADDGAESQEAAKTEGEPVEILVAAAASLKNAYEEELIPMFEERYPGVSVEGTYDSSGKLQTQIGGPGGRCVHVSSREADEGLDEEGMIASDTITNLLENKIVLIIPAGSSAGLHSLKILKRQASSRWGILPVFRQASMHRKPSQA